MLKDKITIAHDRTLREIAALQPESKDQLEAVWGLGSARIERYGSALLTALTDPAPAEDAAPRSES